MGGVQPIRINIVDKDGNFIRQESVKVNVQDCIVFEFSNSKGDKKDYDVCGGELQLWSKKSPNYMELTEEEYKNLMILAKADGNASNITETDFNNANKGKVPSGYTLIEDEYNDDHYFGINDKKGNMFQVYESQE